MKRVACILFVWMIAAGVGNVRGQVSISSIRDTLHSPQLLDTERAAFSHFLGMALVNPPLFGFDSISDFQNARPDSAFVTCALYYDTLIRDSTEESPLKLLAAPMYVTLPITVNGVVKSSITFDYEGKWQPVMYGDQYFARTVDSMRRHISRKQPPDPAESFVIEVRAFDMEFFADASKRSLPLYPFEFYSAVPIDSGAPANSLFSILRHQAPANIRKH